MKTLDVKELLELFAPAMVNRNKLFFRKEISDIVPVAEQGKFVKNYKNNVTYADGVYTVSETTGDVTSVPAYNYFVVYERPLIEENQKRIKNLKFFFEGFETYGELKQRVQDKNFDTGLFIVYIKDYIGYRMMQFNVFYDEENDKWTDLYIPCLGEIYDVQITYDNDEATKVTQEPIAGVFCSQDDIENFIQEVIVFEQMLKRKPFVITGVYNYEGVINEFNVEYDKIVSSFDSWPTDEEIGAQYISAYGTGYSQGFKKGYIARLSEEDEEPSKEEWCECRQLGYSQGLDQGYIDGYRECLMGKPCFIEDEEIELLQKSEKR